MSYGAWTAVSFTKAQLLLVFRACFPCGRSGGFPERCRPVPNSSQNQKTATRLGWGVHLFTASGIVVGMLALDAVYANLEKLAIVYLLLTQLIDGIDGPMARNLNVRQTVPKIDGYVLDLVIDFVTCVVVPAVFLHQFDLLPNHFSLLICGLVVLLSAIWFSRTDMMTEDNWFRGFPATWNLIVPTLYVMESTQWMNAVLIGGLAVLMLTNVQFPHPVRVSENRLATLPFTAIWIGALLWGTLRLPDTDFLVQFALYASIAYYVVICARRTIQSRTADAPPAASPTEAV